MNREQMIIEALSQHENKEELLQALAELKRDIALTCRREAMQDGRKNERIAQAEGNYYD